MEIEGKLLQLMPVQNISSQKGQMKKMDFVIEIESKFPKKVCFALWNDKIDLLKAKAGDQIKVYFDLESREDNGRWYTEAKAWKVEGASSPELHDNEMPEMKDDLPSSFSSSKEDLDDLPF
jgi:Domain of unknown function (DUF3127)